MPFASEHPNVRTPNVQVEARRVASGHPGGGGVDGRGRWAGPLLIGSQKYRPPKNSAHDEPQICYTSFRLSRKEGYNFELIRDEMPRIDVFTADERRFLESCERTFRERVRNYPRELYAKEMERLGIDLSWKSSEIEGNTYTLLETVNLLKDRIEASGRRREEAIMLLNHKEALKAIVARPDYFMNISLARMEDIHAVLIDGLGVDRNLRHVRVGISGTNYRPLDVESQIREAVEDMCALVNGKTDAYEKAFLTLLLISYIQPFVDGNKRTSRLMSNALLVARGVCPLSFRTVAANDYRAALLLFYEQNNLSAFKRMFLEQVEFAVKEYF